MSRILDQGLASESDRRQKAQKTKAVAELLERLINDVIKSVKDNSRATIWKVGIRTPEKRNEL